MLHQHCPETAPKIDQMLPASKWCLLLYKRTLKYLGPIACGLGRPQIGAAPNPPENVKKIFEILCFENDRSCYTNEHFWIAWLLGLNFDRNKKSRPKLWFGAGFACIIPPQTLEKLFWNSVFWKWSPLLYKRTLLNCMAARFEFWSQWKFPPQTLIWGGFLHAYSRPKMLRKYLKSYVLKMVALAIQTNTFELHGCSIWILITMKIPAPNSDLGRVFACIILPKLFPKEAISGVSWFCEFAFNRKFCWFPGMPAAAIWGRDSGFKYILILAARRFWIFEILHFFLNQNTT